MRVRLLQNETKRVLKIDSQVFEIDRHVLKIDSQVFEIRQQVLKFDSQVFENWSANVFKIKTSPQTLKTELQVIKQTFCEETITTGDSLDDFFKCIDGYNFVTFYSNV